MRLRWEDLPSDLKPIAPRLAIILQKWKGTPYLQQSMVPKVGVDCVRFTCGALDDAYRLQRCPTKFYPADQSLHNRRGAIAAMKFIMKRYQPNERLPDDSPVQPFDLVVTGPNSGGPGHAMLVGVTTQLWHIAGPGSRVTPTSLLIPRKQSLFAVFRCSDRSRWFNTPS